MGTKPVGFRVDEKQEKVLNRFKQALSRKYGKLHGVFSNVIIELMEQFLASPSAQQTHTNPPTQPTRFHRTLAKIYSALPNGGRFKSETIDLAIEKHAGGDPRTKRTYRKSLFSWGLVLEFNAGPDSPKQVIQYYELGTCPDWIKEILEGE